MYAPLVTLAFAAVASAGSLYLSLGLGLKACPLCFYQRTMAFAVVGVLATGLCLFPRGEWGKLNVLVLPLCLTGLGVAAFHTNLVTSGKLMCPNGIADLGPAPAQSLAAFVLVLLPILYGVFVESRAECLKPLPLIVAAAVGVGAYYGSTTAGVNPPPQTMTEGEKLDTCKKPYQPPAP